MKQLFNIFMPLFIIGLALPLFAKPTPLIALKVRTFTVDDAVRLAERLTNKSLDTTMMKQKDKKYFLKFYAPGLRIRYHKMNGYFDIVLTNRQRDERIYSKSDFPPKERLIELAKRFVKENHLINTGLVDLDAKTMQESILSMNAKTHESVRGIREVTVILRRKLKNSGVPVLSYRNIEVSFKPGPVIDRVRVYTHPIVKTTKASPVDKQVMDDNRDLKLKKALDSFGTGINNVNLVKTETVYMEADDTSSTSVVIPYKLYFYKMDKSDIDGHKGFIIRVPMVDIKKSSSL